MDSLYKFSIIPQDLRREEYVVQIVDSLQHMTDVVDDIFKRIDERINLNASKTRNLSERVSVCRNKIEKLTDTNKATKVYSSAKYPAMNCFQNYKTVFDHRQQEIIMKRSENEIKTKPGSYNDNQIQEKLEFYHVKTTCPNLYQWLTENQPNSGLGDIPYRVENICSLLLFNNNNFVYDKKSAKQSNHPSMQFVTPSMDDKHGAVLDDAPFSISNKDQASKKAAESYLYSPGLGEAPLMDMPMDLPYLSGVAEDLQFMSETGPAIAPSACFSLLPDDIKSVVEEPVEIIVADDRKSVDVQPPKLEVVQNVGPTIVSAAPLPPPPPPPPPPAPVEDLIKKELSEIDSATVKHSATSISTVKSGDGRANLMDAIRKAGGTGKAKLRSTADIDKNEQKGNAGNTGGDLMADLHAKLSMRRKGISGARKNVDGSILDVISAMIPPPVSKPLDQTSNADASSAEDDWE